MDVEQGGGDTLKAFFDPDFTDLATKYVNYRIDLVLETARYNFVRWETDGFGDRTGWTIVYQPGYPAVELPAGTVMYPSATGLRVLPVFHEYGDRDMNVTNTAKEGGEDSDVYVDTIDWVVPNTTCDEVTIYCPLPHTWAHINYTTPADEPVTELIGTQCEQITNGTSPTICNVVGPGGRLKKGSYWAANCGSAESHFYLEKISCGAERHFDYTRGIIKDSLQLLPNVDYLNWIMDTYYTTKAPVDDGGMGFHFIDQDYHVRPVLPPKVNCSCEQPMSAIVSFLGFGFHQWGSGTPGPQEAVTVEPEILKLGESQINGYMDVYKVIILCWRGG